MAHWYQQRFNSQIDREMVAGIPSVIYMVAQLIRHWSQPGDGVVTFTPAYDAFFKVVDGNQRQMLACPLIKNAIDWALDAEHLESLLAQPACTLAVAVQPA